MTTFAQAMNFAKTMNWSDIDEGYETLHKALIDLGFKWSTNLKNDVKCFVKINGATQLAVELPKGDVCANGSPLCEFAVIAGIFTGMAAVLKQPSLRNCTATPVQRNGSNITFVVGIKDF